MSHIQEKSWPVLTSYDQSHLTAIALPLGGIGTGSVALGGRGDLRQWEIVNRPSRHFIPKHSFFALYTRAASGQSRTKVLEGRLEPPYEGAEGSPAPLAGLPRFRHCSYAAAYPLGQVLLSDEQIPVTVRIQGFNPLIPADVERSSIPVAILRFVVENTTNEPVTASICGSLQNFIGTDGVEGQPQENENSFRQDTDVQGIFLHSRGVSPQAEQYGTLALTTTARTGVTYRTTWAREAGWRDALHDFWDDFSSDGQLDPREPLAGNDTPEASLSVRVELAPRETQAITFLLTWHFPNRQTWTPQTLSAGESSRVGNYYTTHFSDAWEVAMRTAAQLDELEAETLAFVSSFCASSLPAVVKEAALYNVSTLRTQTYFRTEDGYFYGWEGCNNTAGWCHGSCTHVWNYEQTTAFLFGDLARRMREVEFLHATDERGHMSFRVNLPLSHATDYGVAAADGQMGCLMKLYRDWKLAGDTDWLKRLWPHARRALEFCWLPGGWDADQDGVMEGCQHNTMDVEYFGPNPQMGFWYLGALRAASEMASALGETDFAHKCTALYTRGSAWLDQHLFNGEYYEQQIQPPAEPEKILPGLFHATDQRNFAHPTYQLGTGCLIDQLVGQYMAHVCGLGYLADSQHIRQTLSSITRYNFREDLSDHFNHMRTYALNDESAHLMASYPRGQRPHLPFPYYNEVMTGFEYVAGIHMLYEGLEEEGLRAISAIRARYDGRRRNPFDEAECGYHYARAMTSWASVLALSGFTYSGLDHTLAFKSAGQDATYFWSNGHAWGTCRQQPTPTGLSVTLSILYGTLTLARLEIQETGAVEYPTIRKLQCGDQIACFIHNHESTF